MQALLAAGAIAAALAGGGLTAAGWWAYDALIDDPAIVRIEQARAAAAIEAAAAQATRDEQLRQFRIGEAAFDRAYAQDQEDAAWQQARVALLMKEIGDYESERLAAGTGCPLTQRDLDFLGRLRDVGPPD